MERNNWKINSKKIRIENLLGVKHHSTYMWSQQPSEAGYYPTQGGKLRLEGFAGSPMLCSLTVLWTAGGVTPLVWHFPPPPCLRITCQQWLLGCSQLLPRKSVRSWGLLLLWWLSFKHLHFIIYEMKTFVCSRCCWRALLTLSLQESQSPLIILKMSTA